MATTTFQKQFHSTVLQFYIEKSCKWKRMCVQDQGEEASTFSSRCWEGTLVDDIWYYAGDRSTDVSRPSQPKYPSPHVFLTPVHQAPHTIRPASAKVTTRHLSSHCTLIVPLTFNSVYPINLHIICPLCPLLSLIVHVGTIDMICQLFINQPNPNVSF